MEFTTRLRKSWIDVYTPDDLLREAKATDAPILVDIGGCTGTDVMELRRRYPDVPGRVILQDLPAVIDSAVEKHGDLMSQVSRSTYLHMKAIHDTKIS